GAITGADRDEVVIGGTTLAAPRVLPAGAATLPVGAVNDGPMLVFDADGDGHSDLLATRGGNSLPAGMPDYQPVLYLGDGHGGFRAAAENALPSLPINVGA